MISEQELRARLTALTLEVQALYLAHPDRAAAVAQLERLADGAQHLVVGRGTVDQTLQLLQKELRAFIAAVE